MEACHVVEDSLAIDHEEASVACTDAELDSLDACLDLEDRESKEGKSGWPARLKDLLVRLC
jgi:hypothetical protein